MWKRSCCMGSVATPVRPRVFDYVLRCRIGICLLSKFLPTPTSQIPVANSGSFHWAWLQFIYFRSVSGGHLSGRGHLCKKYYSRETFSRHGQNLCLFSV